MVKNSKLQKRQAPRNENEKKEPTKEVAKSFERDSQGKREKIKTRKQKPTNAPSPTPAVHLLTSRSDVKT